MNATHDGEGEPLGSPDILENKTHDFHGFTAPDAAPGQAGSRAAKAALDGYLIETPTAWGDMYRELLSEQGLKEAKERWDWRKCLYVAWRCAPAKTRTPKTLDELADFMGLSNTATIRHWRAKDPELETRIAQMRVGLVDRHISDLLQASIDVALNDGKDGHQDRKMLLEIANVYKPKTVTEMTGDGLRIVIDYADPTSDPA